jgi:hypothetical protein
MAVFLMSLTDSNCCEASFFKPWSALFIDKNPKINNGIRPMLKKLRMSLGVSFMRGHLFVKVCVGSIIDSTMDFTKLTLESYVPERIV